MNKPHITTSETAIALDILSSENGPFTAAELAGRLYLTGSRETQRRRIRAIVKRLRDDGAMIIATLAGGYQMTRNEAAWRDYLEGRQIEAKKTLGSTYKKKRQILSDKAGQGLLFSQKINMGVATMEVA